VLGDSVNVAARLAATAEPGETLVTETTCRETRRQFALGAARSFAPRGRTTRVEIRSLRGVRRTRTRVPAPGPALPLVGRRVELARLEGLLAEADRGRGHAVGVVGAAGIGKTRLVAELAGQAARRGFLVHSGACESYADPYAVWRGVWRSVLGIGESWSPARTQEHVERHLRGIDPRLADRAPLLRGVLGIGLADTPLTASMAPDVVAASLEALLVDCLRDRAARAPVVLVLEDCHWIDEDSLRLLDSLVARALRLPVLLVATYRDDADPHRLAGLRSALGDTELQLAPLTAGETGRLAREALGGDDGATDVAARIELIAQGNPLYVEELARLIRSRPQALEPSSFGELDLPDRLQSLVLARVDQLPETVKSVLKVASVVGGAFQPDVVAGSYPPFAEGEPVADALEELVQLDLAAPSGQAGSYRFRHSLIEEVVYNSLSIAAREELHERVGEYMEARDEAVATVDVLAYHYGRSARLDKQREYFRRAGDAARERYAGEAALGYYERLVRLLAGAERGEAVQLAGQTAQFVGRWEDAETHYREALTLARASGDERAQATAEAALGRLLSYTESHEAALASLRTADDRFRRLGDLSGRRGMLESLALTLLRAGEPDAARRTAEEHLSLALTAGDRVEASAALNNLGAIAWRAGDHDTAVRSLRRALEDATAADDAARVAHAANDLAGVYADLGDDARALTHVQLGIDAATRIGYPQLRCLLVGNAGELYRHRGAYSSALACYREALEGALTLGDAMQSALFTGNAAAAALALGRHEEAETLLTWALARARQLGEPYLLGELLFLLCRAVARSGRLDEALDLAEESSATAADHHPEIAVKASVASDELRVGLGLGKREDAVRRLEAQLAGTTEPWARAEILDAIARLDPGRIREREQAAVLYRRLYDASEKVDYADRYAELTGDTLHSPRPLGPITLSLPPDVDPLAAIVERVRPPGNGPGNPPARAAATGASVG
jgi:tetratricopeptide (TPR) repeat protein